MRSGFCTVKQHTGNHDNIKIKISHADCDVENAIQSFFFYSRKGGEGFILAG